MGSQVPLLPPGSRFLILISADPADIVQQLFMAQATLGIEYNGIAGEASGGLRLLFFWGPATLSEIPLFVLIVLDEEGETVVLIFFFNGRLWLSGPGAVSPWFSLHRVAVDPLPTRGPGDGPRPLINSVGGNFGDRQTFFENKGRCLTCGLRLIRNLFRGATSEDDGQGRAHHRCHLRIGAPPTWWPVFPAITGKTRGQTMWRDRSPTATRALPVPRRKWWKVTQRSSPRRA